MIPALPILLDEFETLSLDDAAFLVQRNVDDLEVCVHFQKKNGTTPWSVWFRLAEEASRQRCSREHLPLVLEAFGLSGEGFAKELAGRLLSQAAFADEFVRNVGDLLGQEALRESIRSTQAFMDGLREMVRRTIGPAQSPSATQGRGHDPQGTGPSGGANPTRPGPTKKGAAGLGESAGKGRLRIIRPGDGD